MFRIQIQSETWGIRWDLEVRVEAITLWYVLQAILLITESSKNITLL